MDPLTFESGVYHLLVLLPAPCRKRVIGMVDKYTKTENGSAMIDYEKLYGVIVEVAEGAGLIQPN
jgi:hypothetical protein